MENDGTVLTDEQHARLESLDWVMYVTEDGEEYFGQVGTDHTQWDMPDDLTESDLVLLRIAMENNLSDSEMDPLEDVDGSQSFAADGTESIVLGSTPSGVERVATTGAASPSDITIDNVDETDKDTDKDTDKNSVPAVQQKSLGHKRASSSRRESFHPAPSFRRNSSLLKTLSTKDIQKARQANGGRTVQTFSPSSNSAEKQSTKGLRRAVEVLSDAEIRNVLVQLGEEEKSIHAFTRNDMIDIVFDGARTDTAILKAMGEVTSKRISGTTTGGGSGSGGNNSNTSNNNETNGGSGGSGFGFKKGPGSHHLKQTRSSAMGMSRHSSFKTSTGAARVGINSKDEWSLEAQAAVAALSKVALDVLETTPGFSTSVANRRSALPELFHEVPNTTPGTSVGREQRDRRDKAKRRRASMLQQVNSTHPETKTNRKKAPRPSNPTAAFTSFILKVVFPPVGIAHRHSKTFNKDALEALKLGVGSSTGEFKTHGKPSSSSSSSSSSTTKKPPRMSVAGGALSKNNLENSDAVKPMDKMGFMNKRGHTVHLMTSNFKKRWFELDTKACLLTYYGEEPPVAYEGDPEEEKKEEQKKSLKKGAVDLSIVEEIKPSEHKKKRAFDLVTATRTWVMVPGNDEDEAGWLANLCKMVPGEGVHAEYREYITMDPKRPHKVQGRSSKESHTPQNGGGGKDVKIGAEIDSQKVLCDPSLTTVGQVLSECFRLFKRRTQQELDAGGSGCCALKVTGLREFMYSQDRLIADYRYVHDQLVVAKRDSNVKGPCTVELQLLPSDVLAELMSEVKHASDPVLFKGDFNKGGGGSSNNYMNRTSTVREDENEEEEEEEGEDEVVGELRVGVMKQEVSKEKRRSSILTVKRGRWEKFEDPDTLEPFWHNSDTGISQWEEPSDWKQHRPSFISTVRLGTSSGASGASGASGGAHSSSEQDQNLLGSGSDVNGVRSSLSALTCVEAGESLLEALMEEEVKEEEEDPHDDDALFAFVGDKALSDALEKKAFDGPMPTSKEGENQENQENHHHHHQNEGNTITTRRKRERPSNKAFSKRNARWPLRINIESLHELTCFELRHVSKEWLPFPIDIVKICVRLRVMLGGQPVLGGTMETIPVPYEPGMRYVHGFKSREGDEWLSTKLNIASLPSSSRLFIEVLGEKNGKDYEGLCDVVLASVCVQLCDHTGRMIHGRRALKLWPNVDVAAREVGHTCPTPWSQTTALDGGVDGSGGGEDGTGEGNERGNNNRNNSGGRKKKKRGPQLSVIDEEALRKKMALLMSGAATPTAPRPRPTLHLSFDQFVAPIMWGSSRARFGGSTGTPRGVGGRMETQNNPKSSSGSGEREKSLLRHQLSSAVSFVNHGSLVNMMYSQDDEEGEDDVNVDMRGMLEVEKKNKWGSRKWKEYWVVLQESTGTLSWFSSKRSDAKCLGSVELAGVNVEECPTKKRIYKKGKGTTLKDAETCCFKVDITGEERNMISGKYGNPVL